jgi:plasmid stabilization system protein ParE
VAYRVNLAQRAERDLDLLYEAIGAEQTRAALKWYQGLKRAVFSTGRKSASMPDNAGGQKISPSAIWQEATRLSRDLPSVLEDQDRAGLAYQAWRDG